jgi:hypothetical protein
MIKIDNLRLKNNIITLKNKKYKLTSNILEVKRLLKNFKSYCYKTSMLSVVENYDSLEFKVFNSVNVISLKADVVML